MMIKYSKLASMLASFWLKLSFSLLFTSCIQKQEKTVITSASSIDYKQVKANLLYQRDSLYKHYLCTTNDSLKDSLIGDAGKLLFSKMYESLLPAWVGTPWDFNGISDTPQQGSIACGMFVTGILKDAGFNIPRIKCGQMASEELILNLTHQVKRFSNAKMETIVAYIKNKGEGIYIVGLDTHVGFIVNTKGQLQFIHSNYYQPHVQVMFQDINDKSPLTDSHYRVIGKILDKEMVVKWMSNASITKKQ